MAFKVTRHYHFYAAHRNELLNDKCRNIHGHTYDVEVSFSLEQQSNGVTILFSDIDKKVQPIINVFDHGFMIHEKDPLYKYLLKFMAEENEQVKLIIFNEVTSVENLSFTLFTEIKKAIPQTISVTVKETKSSEVTYE